MKITVEDIRKRANIAKRKRVNKTANQLPRGLANEGASDGHTLNTAAGNGDILSNWGQPSQNNLEQQDFEVITHFFASGGGDDEDDERVWQELEKHVRVYLAF